MFIKKLFNLKIRKQNKKLEKLNQTSSEGIEKSIEALVSV